MLPLADGLVVARTPPSKAGATAVRARGTRRGRLQPPAVPSWYRTRTECGALYATSSGLPSCAPSDEAAGAAPVTAPGTAAGAVQVSPLAKVSGSGVVAKRIRCVRWPRHSTYKVPWAVPPCTSAIAGAVLVR